MRNHTRPPAVLATAPGPTGCGGSGANRKQPKAILRPEPRRRRADQLAVGHIVADQFLHRPGVQGLAMRFEGDQVVRRQVVQPVGQTAREPPTAPAQDYHVEKLLLLRQVALHFHRERRVGEEVHEEQAEQAMPVAQGIPIDGHRTALLVLIELCSLRWRRRCAGGPEVRRGEHQRSAKRTRPAGRAVERPSLAAAQVGANGRTPRSAATDNRAEPEAEDEKDVIITAADTLHGGSKPTFGEHQPFGRSAAANCAARMPSSSLHPGKSSSRDRALFASISSMYSSNVCFLPAIFPA